MQDDSKIAYIYLYQSLPMQTLMGSLEFGFSSISREVLNYRK